MNDHAHRRADGKPHRVGYAVIDSNKTDAEAADIDHVSRRDGTELLAAHAVLLQPP